MPQRQIADQQPAPRIAEKRQIQTLKEAKWRVDEFLRTTVHRVASLLKRWLLGTHQGSVSNWQLDYYLDEFTFRFNRRTSSSRGLLFYRLVQQAAATSTTCYRGLVGGSAVTTRS